MHNWISYIYNDVIFQPCPKLDVGFGKVDSYLYIYQYAIYSSGYLVSMTSANSFLSV